MKDLQQEIIKQNFIALTELHPDFAPSPSYTNLFNVIKKQMALQIESEYCIAQAFHTEKLIPEDWQGDLLLDFTEYHDIIFQSKKAKQILQDNDISKRTY